MSNELELPAEQDAASENSKSKIQNPQSESEPVAVEDVEQVLNQRIAALQTSPVDVVMPARMSNLVVYCDTAELARDISGMIPRIMALHPARVLLLLAQSEVAGADLTTTLIVRKHPVRDERAFCSEQINLTASGTAVSKLPYVVWSLIVGDLPVKLWWASNVPPPLGGELFHELAENAEQVVFDSFGWRDPPRGMAAVASWIQELEKSPTDQRWRLAADLNWRRLKYWRRLVSQALDPATAPGLLDFINDVVLEHGPHAVIQAWELVSWLAARLGWQVETGRVQPGIEMVWQFQARQGPIRVRIVRLEDCRPTLCRVRIASPKKALSFTVGSERRLAVFEEGTRSAPRTISVQPASLADMVGREFSDRERDPVFRASLGIARELAQSVLRY